MGMTKEEKLILLRKRRRKFLNEQREDYLKNYSLYENLNSHEDKTEPLYNATLALNRMIRVLKKESRENPDSTLLKEFTLYNLEATLNKRTEELEELIGEKHRKS
ncbi:MAG: hypothetical protein ACE5J4_00775 [Candidatus Aenigmatarchaeota archaeon]